MNKLITYLKQGNGHGLKAVLIFTLLISFLLWGIIYAFVRKIPDNSALNDFIHQLPTVVIQDGIVVEPANANTTYSVQGQPLFYLQTDQGTGKILVKGSGFRVKGYLCPCCSTSCMISYHCIP